MRSIMLLVRTVAILNQKGGVGKTTTVANLGAAIAARGRSVCLIDLDPQAHLTLHMGVEPGKPELSIYDVLTANAPLAKSAINISKNLLLIPSVIDLAAAEMELASTVGREQILRDQLRTAELPCELAVIDCPPSLGLLTLNALAACDEVYIPLQPHFLALQGLGKLLETVSLVQRRINPSLRVGGAILCMYESTTKLSGEVVADLRGFVESARGQNMPWSDMVVFNTVIRRNIKLAECPSYGKTIFDYEPHSNGANDYAALADEFFAHALAGAAQPSHVASPQPAVASEPIAPAQESLQPAALAEPVESLSPASSVASETASTPAIDAAENVTP